MKNLILLLTLLFTFGTATNVYSQTTKKSRTYKKYKAKKNNSKKVYRESSQKSNGRVIYTGPRGGRYYINSNGNKTYIK